MQKLKTEVLRQTDVSRNIKKKYAKKNNTSFYNVTINITKWFLPK